MSLISFNGKKKRNKKPDQKLMLTITQGAGQSEMFGAIFYKIFYIRRLVSLVSRGIRVVSQNIPEYPIIFPKSL